MIWVLFVMFMAMVLGGGVLLGLHIQNRRQQTRWFQQGFNSGAQRGWKNAAAQLEQDVHVMTQRQLPEYTPDYLAGYEDASERLYRYWDKLEGREAHGVH